MRPTNDTLHISQNIEELLLIALKEDTSAGDVTTKAIGGLKVNAQGVVIAKCKCKICGLPLVKELVNLSRKDITVKPIVLDGAEIELGGEIVILEGCLEDILLLERTVLNFLQHLSGIATHTYKLVQEAKLVPLYDTRKTHPGYRELEKYAVRVGGGYNHRLNLSDQILIKDNHIDGSDKQIDELVLLAKKNAPKGVLVEVEVRTLDELEKVLHSEPDIILLDNMDDNNLAKAVYMIREYSSKIEIEVSGNVTKERFNFLAQFNLSAKEKNQQLVRVSMGSLTYGAGWVDLSMKIKKNN